MPVALGTAAHGAVNPRRLPFFCSPTWVGGLKWYVLVQWINGFNPLSSNFAPRWLFPVIYIYIYMWPVAAVAGGVLRRPQWLRAGH
jgi:hypothetical protein